MLSRSLFAIGCAVAMNCAAWAGAGQAYTASQEQGVVVFRGQPANAPLPTVAEIYQNREAEKRLQAEAQRQAALKRLDKRMAQQTEELRQINERIETIAKNQDRPKRRKVYYGNPAFFGPNGFIGNRNFGGSTILLPRRPRHRPKD